MVKPLHLGEGRRAAPPPPALVPFVYSFVEYDPASPLQWLLALSSLAPLLILAALAAALLSRRDFHTATLLLGLVLNEALNHALKYAVREPRPAPTLHPAFDAQSPYGWPSDHAQFMAFLLAYACCWAPAQWRAPAQLKGACLAALGLAAALVALSRVALRYHSAAQVGAGLGVGAAWGAAWFCATEALLRPRFAWAAAQPWARWALLRDATHANVLLEEYAALSRPQPQPQQAAQRFSGGGSSKSSAGAASAADEGKGFV